MLFATFVIKQRSLGDGLDNCCCADLLPPAGVTGNHLKKIESPSAIAAGFFGKQPDRIIGEGLLFGDRGQCPFQDMGNIVIGERFKDKDVAAGQEGWNDFKRGVFGRGADEDDRA